MKRYFAMVALLGLACSGQLSTGPDEQSTVTGPLRLTVTDSLAQPGVLFALPNVTVSPSTITVTNTRYGSLCLYEVTGNADVGTSTVVLRINYSQRFALCTGEIRKLSYRAEITGLVPKAYEVRVVHVENNTSQTLVTQTVTVP